MKNGKWVQSSILSVQCAHHMCAWIIRAARCSNCRRYEYEYSHSLVWVLSIRSHTSRNSTKTTTATTTERLSEQSSWPCYVCVCRLCECVLVCVNVASCKLQLRLNFICAAVGAVAPTTGHRLVTAAAPIRGLGLGLRLNLQPPLGHVFWPANSMDIRRLENFWPAHASAEISVIVSAILFYVFFFNIFFDRRKLLIKWKLLSRYA